MDQQIQVSDPGTRQEMSISRKHSSWNDTELTIMRAFENDIAPAVSRSPTCKTHTLPDGVWELPLWPVPRLQANKSSACTGRHSTDVITPPILKSLIDQTRCEGATNPAAGCILLNPSISSRPPLAVVGSSRVSRSNEKLKQSRPKNNLRLTTNGSQIARFWVQRQRSESTVILHVLSFHHLR
jgi:hypothetical protein